MLQKAEWEVKFPGVRAGVPGKVNLAVCTMSIKVKMKLKDVYFLSNIRRYVKDYN